MSEYKRLKENIETLYAHNERHIPVFHITGGTQHEIDLIREIVSDCREILKKIEQGTLIELPCKVGDTVYWVWEEFTNGKQKLSIEEWKVEVIHIEENDWAVKGFGKEREDGSRPFFWCHSSRFGIWWFLTREEAEKRLKELRNG